MESKSSKQQDKKVCEHCTERKKFEASLLAPGGLGQAAATDSSLDLASLLEKFLERAGFEKKKCLAAEEKLEKLEARRKQLELERAKLDEQLQAISLTLEEQEQLQMYRKQSSKEQVEAFEKTENGSTPFSEAQEETSAVLAKKGHDMLEINACLEETIAREKVAVARLRESQKEMQDKLESVAGVRDWSSESQQKGNENYLAFESTPELDASMLKAGFSITYVDHLLINCQNFAAIMCSIRVEGVMLKLQEAFDSVLQQEHAIRPYENSLYHSFKSKRTFSKLLEAFVKDEESIFQGYLSSLPDHSPALGMMLFARSLFSGEVERNATQKMTTTLLETFVKPYRSDPQALLQISELCIFISKRLSSFWRKELAEDKSDSAVQAQAQLALQNFHMYGMPPAFSFLPDSTFPAGAASSTYLPGIDPSHPELATTGYPQFTDPSQTYSGYATSANLGPGNAGVSTTGRYNKKETDANQKEVSRTSADKSALALLEELRAASGSRTAPHYSASHTNPDRGSGVAEETS